MCSHARARALSITTHNPLRAEMLNFLSCPMLNGVVSSSRIDLIISKTSLVNGCQCQLRLSAMAKVSLIYGSPLSCFQCPDRSQQTQNNAYSLYNSSKASKLLFLGPES